MAAGGAVIALAERPCRNGIGSKKRATPSADADRGLSGARVALVPAGAQRAIALEIDAASAFGTGEHPSTRGCLLALVRLARKRRFRDPLDIGTGSGILAIAASKLLARRIQASDIDAGSVRVARHHVRRNGLAGGYG